MCGSVGNSNCTVIMPGPQPNSSGWDLGEDGKLWNGSSGKLSQSNDVIVLMLICMYVFVVPPVVGAWSMAVLLWQLFEYYYLGGTQVNIPI